MSLCDSLAPPLPSPPPAQALLEGDVPLAPLCPAVTDADVQRGEVKENAQIALRESQRMSCSVCFARGQERQACFAVEGLPALVKAGQPPGGWAGGWAAAAGLLAELPGPLC